MYDKNPYQAKNFVINIHSKHIFILFFNKHGRVENIIQWEREIKFEWEK